MIGADIIENWINHPNKGKRKIGRINLFEDSADRRMNEGARITGLENAKAEFWWGLSMRDSSVVNRITPLNSPRFIA